MTFYTKRVYVRFKKKFFDLEKKLYLSNMLKYLKDKVDIYLFLLHYFKIFTKIQ